MISWQLVQRPSLRESNHEPGKLEDHTRYFSSQVNEPLRTPFVNNHHNPKSDFTGKASAHEIDRGRDMRDDPVNRDIQQACSTPIGVLNVQNARGERLL